MLIELRRMDEYNEHLLTITLKFLSDYSSALFFYEILSHSFIWNVLLYLPILPNCLCCSYVLGSWATSPSLEGAAYIDVLWHLEVQSLPGHQSQILQGYSLCGLSMSPVVGTLELLQHTVRSSSQPNNECEAQLQHGWLHCYGHAGRWGLPRHSFMWGSQQGTPLVLIV